jgi:hypothetical protein
MRYRDKSFTLCSQVAIIWLPGRGAKPRDPDGWRCSEKNRTRSSPTKALYHCGEGYDRDGGSAQTHFELSLLSSGSFVAMR